MTAREKKSFLGFGGEANVHIWGTPVLDQAQQTLRLANIELAVESEAAFGLLGTAYLPAKFRIRFLEPIPTDQWGERPWDDKGLVQTVADDIRLRLAAHFTTATTR